MRRLITRTVRTVTTSTWTITWTEEPPVDRHDQPPAPDPAQPAVNYVPEADPANELTGALASDANAA